MGDSLEIRKNSRGQLIQVRVDEEGNVLASYGVAGEPTGIMPYLRSDNPREYYRIYYRNIRRYRDGRKPRKADLDYV